MPLIEGRERVHYDQVIVDAGLNVDDFEITEEKDTPESKERSSMAYIGTGWITVTYKPTDIARKYRYDVVPPPWLQFDRELKMDLFKTR